MGASEEMTQVKEEQKGDICIFSLKGRLDALSSPETEKKIFQAINSGKQKLLLDLSSVTYLSSAGMRMLLSTAKKLRTLSGKLVVCGMTSPVMDVLKLSGFDHVLELFHTQEDALKHF